MNLRIAASAAAAAAVFIGCGPTEALPEDELGSITSQREDDDHRVAALEGAEVLAAVDREGVSPVIEADEPFVRFTTMWEAAEVVPFEVRTSADGRVFGEWVTVTVVHTEEGLTAGHADAVEGARFYQYRLPLQKGTPTFLTVGTLKELGAGGGSDPDLGSGEEPMGADYGDGTASAEQALAAKPRIMTRADWGAKAPRCRTAMSFSDRATIHHTVTPTNDTVSPQARLRAIQAFHMNSNGWCDIGYNYLVSRDGRVWTGRGHLSLGAHTTNGNSGNQGISFIGTYSSTPATSTQLCQAGRLLAHLHRLHPALSLNRTDVKGHRQRNQTSCPGDRLFSQIDSIIARAKNGCN